MRDFKIGDKVLIKSNLFYIGGIFNHLTDDAKKKIFNKIIGPVSACWDNEIIGDILEIGENNIYLIRSGNDKYVFTNNYNEMELYDTYVKCDSCNYSIYTGHNEDLKQYEYDCDCCGKILCEDCTNLKDDIPYCNNCYCDVMDEE